MDDKKRNQQSQSGNEEQSGDQGNQEQQNVSNEQNQNPQDGASWNNYRTREMSGGQEGDENFYRNRERGNYEEGQRSDEGSGGSLF